MRLHCWITLLLASLLLDGCSVSLRHPLPAADPALVLHSAFIGTWSVVEVVGQVPGEPIEVRVVLDDAQNLVAELTTGSLPQSQAFHLAQVEGLVLAFAEDERAGGWDVVQLELDGTGQRMTVRALDVSRIRQDIAAGVLAGRIEGVDVEDVNTSFMEIDADSGELAAYITADPTVFVDAAVLSKVE